MQIQTLFNSNEVRVITEGDCFHFVASDIASILGYRDSHNLLRVLSLDEKGTRLVSTPGGAQQVSVITESGLYHAIFKSRKKEAEVFREWVTGEVLPTLRRTGTYTIKISPAQAQTLKEKVQTIVDSGVQKHGETWARFQRKFRVNSYLELPASQFEDACAYLDGKLENPVREALGHLANAVNALSKGV